MPRVRLAALALVAVATLGGCYKYDMRATNSASQDVRISLHKGKKHREISTVVLTPGSSVGWTGQSQRPLVLRFAAEPGAAQTVDVVVPRKLHTEFDVAFEGGALAVTSDRPLTVWGAEEPPAEGDAGGAVESTEPPVESAPGAPEAEPAGEEPAVDLVEPDGSGS